MADYYSVLRRAVEALDSNTAGSRQNVYDRSRRAVLDQLRAIEPPLDEAAIRHEIAGLEAAINRIESEQTPTILQDDAAPGDLSALAEPRSKLAWFGLAGLVGVVIVAAVAYAFLSRPRPQMARQAAPAQSERLQEIADAQPSYVFRRQPVYYRSDYPVGTIVIHKSQWFLYLVQPNVVALRYGLGLGNECVDAVGLRTLVRKGEPAGAVATPAIHALYLDPGTLRIDGTDSASAIGRIVNPGCFRILNNDLADLANRAPVGARVVVLN